MQYFSTFYTLRYTENNICMSNWANRCLAAPRAGASICYFNTLVPCLYPMGCSHAPLRQLSGCALHCISVRSVLVLFAPSRLIDRGELNKAFSFSYHLKFKMFWNPLINSYNIENVVDDITYFWKLSSGGKLARLFLAK